MLLEADPPAHSVVRKPMLHLMTPKVAQGLRADFSAAADALVEELVDRGAFDGVMDLAEVYPIHVFADAIGLPQDGRHHLLPYAAMTFNAFGPANALREESFAGSGPVIEWATAACQRDALSPDGFGAQIWAAVDRGEITADAKVLVFFGSANRDPRRWGDTADRYDIHRRAAGHVAFGAGVHVCIGQFIARLEGELILSALARRAATLTFTGDPVPKPNNTLKSFRHLPLRVTTART